MATLSLFAKGYQQPFVQKYFSEYLQAEMTNNNKNIVIPQSFYSFVFATHSFLSLQYLNYVKEDTELATSDMEEFNSFLKTYSNDNNSNTQFDKYFSLFSPFYLLVGSILKFLTMPTIRIFLHRYALTEEPLPYTSLS